MSSPRPPTKSASSSSLWRKGGESGGASGGVKHVICMVGLPARGKTYIAKKLARYLNWSGIVTRVFNVGWYRRQAARHHLEYQHHEFFQASNTEAMKIRQNVADAALQDTLDWLLAEEDGGDVAIFDATNVTLQRRQVVYQRVVQEHGLSLLFIESVCDKPDLVSSNIKEVKVHGPDYDGMNKEEAVQDFMRRIEHYLEVYEPMDEEKESTLSYMKVINAGEQLVINRQQGNLQSRIGYWLMNLHLTPRTIYFTRHGESEMNVLGRIGGNADLSPRGRQYADKLADYINGLNIPGIRVWTSWFKRTIQTAAGIVAPQERWKALNEIDAGICEELTYEEIKARHPVDFAARERNKLKYRYPGGESYEDLISRLESVIMELERQENVVLVGHQAVLRCLLCYFMEKPLEELPYVKVPLHTLIKLTPVAYGCEVEMIPFDVEAVDTYRPRAEAATAGDAAAMDDKIDRLASSAAEQLQVGDGDELRQQVGAPKFVIE